MLENKDIVSIQNSLIAGNYQHLLSDLRRLGRPIKQAWFSSPLVDNAEKYKFTSNKAFKEFLVQKTNLNIPELANIGDISQQVNHLKNQLSLLSLFLTVWKDDPKSFQEPEAEQIAITEAEKKKLRQQIKFKAMVDKSDRHLINIGLLTTVFILCQQCNDFIKYQENALEIYAVNRALTVKETNKFKEMHSKQDLLNFISRHIKNLNNFKFDRYPEAINDSFPLIDKQQEIEKIGLAISSFQTPNKKKKLINYVGILLALIASLACALSTGGAIFLVFPSLPILGIILGTLIGLFGFSANFGFFSQNFPNFLLSLLKKGGISEYIDAEGKRRQLSKLKKYLFIPIAVLASFSVGIGTTAITYTTVLALTSKLLPILALIWPPLPLIIVGILAAAIGITLTVAVLTATIAAIKNSQNFTWASVKAKIANLTKPQILAYLFKGFLVSMGLFGLAYYRYTAGLDLAIFIGPIAAGIMSAFAYVPQAFFTIFSIHKLIRFFSPAHTQQEKTFSPAKSGLNRLKSIANSIYAPISLVGNALGNAALVVVDSISALSISGAIGCFINSWAGNMPEQNKDLQQKRNLATDALIKELENFSHGTEGDTSTLTRSFNQMADKGKITPKHSYGVTPKEPNSIFKIPSSSPSPSYSDDCLPSTSSGFNTGKKVGNASFFKRGVNEPKAEFFNNNRATPVM